MVTFNATVVKRQIQLFAGGQWPVVRWWAVVGAGFGLIDEVLLSERPSAFAPGVGGFWTIGVTMAASQPTTSSPEK